jgi:hypothetical protein
MRPLERGRKTPRRAAGSECHCGEYRGSGRPAQQRAEQLHRRRIGPVEVVEHEYERTRPRELLEQRPHRAVAAVALVLERHRATVCERRQRREDMRELRLHVVVEGGEQVGVEALDVLIQRVHEDRKRQLALELRRRPQEDQVPMQLCTSRQLREEARLADPGLANQLDGTGQASVELVENPLEHIELGGAPHERVLLARWSLSHPVRHRASLAVRDVCTITARASSGRARIAISISTDVGGSAALREVARQRNSGCGFRVAPRCRGDVSAASSNHGSLPPPALPPAAGVWSRLRFVQGACESASPPTYARVVPLGGARDLVDGGRRH